MDRVNILLVEDNNDLRFLYSKTLQDSGFLVSAVANGNEALESIRSGSYDLLLLDIVMPVVDGIQLLAQLYKEYTKIPVKTVLLTNFGYKDIVKQAGTYGVYDVLQKSDITPTQLVEKVREYLS